MAFIRAYKPSDFEATGYICRATLPPSLARSEAARRAAPYLWTHQYTLLSPSTCHVLDDGTGRAVGYCIGCPNVRAFAAAYPRYVAEVLEDPAGELAGRPRPRGSEVRVPWNLAPETGTGTGEVEREVGEVNEEAMLQQAWNPELLLLDEDRRALWEGWRATMHIDLLDEWQGKGWGRRLIERFLESVREADDGAVAGGEEEREGRRIYGKGVHIGIGGENGKVVAFYEKMGFRVFPTGDTGSIWMVRDV